MAPTRSASSEYDTASGSSEHEEVDQQPPRLPEHAGSDNDSSDSNEEESNEEMGDNEAASNDVLAESESEDDEVPSKKAPSPSGPQSSSEQDTSSGSSGHDEVDQQHPPLAEQQNAGSDDYGSDSDEKESDEDNGAAQKPSLSDSNDMVPDSQCKDDEVPPKTYRKAPSPSAPQSSSEEDDHSSGSRDEEEESGEKDQVPDAESNSNPNEAPPPKPAPIPEESLPVAVVPTEKSETKRKLSSTAASPQLKKNRPAEVITQHDMATPTRDGEKLFKEKCGSYSLLGPKLLVLAEEYPGIKIPFLKMDDNKARELDDELHDIDNRVTNALIKLLKSPGVCCKCGHYGAH